METAMIKHQLRLGDHDHRRLPIWAEDIAPVIGARFMRRTRRAQARILPSPSACGGFQPRRNVREKILQRLGQRGLRFAVMARDATLRTRAGSRRVPDAGAPADGRR